MKLNQMININENIFYFPELKKSFSKSFFIYLNTIKFKQKYSELYLKKDVLIKIVKAQKNADYIRRCFNSQAKREYMGANILRSIGIKTPKVYGYGFNVNPFQKIDSLLVIEYIDSHNLVYFFQNIDSIEYRKKILKNVAIDLANIHAHNLHHKDTNLGNIIFFKEELYWIDNDIIKISWTEDTIYNIFNSLKRMVGKKKYLSNEEISYFIDKYISELETDVNKTSNNQIIELVKTLNREELLK